MYIHKHKEWPKFTWNSGELTSLLSSVRHRQGIIFGQMQAIGFPLQEEAVLKALTLEVMKSSEIEGELLNLDEVRSSIARRLGIDTINILPISRFVEGVVEMMLDATQNFETLLTEERLYNWHAALFPTGRSGMYKIKTGAWREAAMQVTSGAMGKETIHFEAPAATLVAKEMLDFLEWLNTNSTLEPILKAGIAHLWFLTIHPFDDGNGRIARAIADMLLARADKSSQRFYSMSAQIMIERNTYYDILEQTQKGTLDITKWLEWFLNCLLRSMDQTNEIITKTITRAQFWQTNKELVLNSRQRKIVQLLLDDFFGILKVSKYAKINKTSSDTALRDLKDLVAKNILTQEGNGRGTHYKLKTTN